ncbi:MAG: response regulator [bacterium]
MSVITIFSGSFCHGDVIAEQVGQQLGYDCVSNEIVEAASRQFDVPYEKLIRVMHGPPSLFSNISRDRERGVAYIKAALAEYLKKDNLVYHGFAGHLIPKHLTHVLRVCIVADREYRTKTAMTQEEISEEKAAHVIETDDIERCRWTQFLFDLGPWDKQLYDIKIPMHTTSVEEAVTLICDNAKMNTLQTTPASTQALNDFILAAKANVVLVEKGHDVEVSCRDGHVTLAINKYHWRVERLQAKLKTIVEEIPGVVDVDTRLGPRFNDSHIHQYDVDVHPRVLLVDDEKEYVLTLSERLQVRNITSQVVFNGEEALSLVQDDEPDVIVLDLMMPGINGMDVLRQLKKDHPKIEVIILTGHGSEKDEELARELGAFAYLQKPVDIEKLTQTMKEAYRNIEKQASSDEDREM